MILPIIKYGAPVLRKKAFDIDKGDPFMEIAGNMALTLKQADGIGLSGPQVGILKNIFVIDTSPFKDQGIDTVEKAYFNPVIIHYNNNEMTYNEGCLSIPGIHEDVLRPDKIEVRYRDIHFDWHEEVLDGLIARIFQHEYDHLRGVLFIDRLSTVKKILIRNKLLEIKRCS
jgi:peptide deformylase